MNRGRILWVGAALALIASVVIWTRSVPSVPSPVSSVSIVAPRPSVPAQSAPTLPASPPRSAPGTSPAWSIVGGLAGVPLDRDKEAFATRRETGVASVGRTALLDSHLPADLRDLRAGQVLQFPLPDGILSGRVNSVQTRPGAVGVGGTLTDGRKGSFSLIQSATGLVGRILVRDRQVAYVIRAGSTGQIQLRELALEDVICQPLPRERTDLSSPASPARPLAAPPVLQSRPGAATVLYLDFDGAVVTDPDWNDGVTISAAACSLGSSEVTEVWNRVKEDFWPFNVNVTTVESDYLNAPVGKRMRVIITPTDVAEPGAGGVALLESIVGAGDYYLTDTPCWVFNQSVNGVAEAISHELGHTLGLAHDGLSSPSTAYYEGHGSGAVGWAPIMGAGYYRNLVQWSKGEYANANNHEDDVGTIAGLVPTYYLGRRNPTGYIADDAGNTRATAAPLGVSGNTVTSVTGIVSSAADEDYYVFAISSAKVITCNVAPAVAYTKQANLDALLELQDSAGNVVASANPDTALGGTLTATVGAGTYYLMVRGTGRSSPTTDGYSNYGSIGQYTLSGGFLDFTPVAPSFTAQPANRSVVVGGTASFSVAASGSPAPTYQWQRQPAAGGSWTNVANGGVYSGATSATLFITGATQAMNGDQFRCVASNFAGVAVSGTATLAVQPNQPPVASFSLSGERTVGQTISVTIDVGDPDGNYQYANLWVHTPGRGWLTIRADDSVVTSGDLVPANTVASSAGTFVRHFTFTPADGAGEYLFSLLAMDSQGRYAQAATQSITVALAQNHPPTAAFSLSAERQFGQTLSISVAVGDPDGNYQYANLWVHTPNRGWLTIRADNSVVVSGDLIRANSVALAAGSYVRQFTLGAIDGAGEYTFVLLAMDAQGSYTQTTPQTIVVTNGAPPPPPFSVASQLDVGVVRGTNHYPIRLPVTCDPGVDPATIVVSSDVSWVTPTLDAVHSEVVLDFSVQGLASATASGKVTLSRGASSAAITIDATIAPMNLVALVDDPVRSRTYGLHRNGNSPGALVVFDPLQETVLGTLTVGRGPGDFAVKPDGQELVVINAASKTISVVDLAQPAVSQTISVPQYSTWGSTDLTGHIQYGAGDILYFTDGAWAPVLHVFRRSTQSDIQTLMSDGSAPNNDVYGFGDIVVSADRSALYGWMQYGWNAGLASSGVAKYTIASDGKVTRAATAAGLYYPAFSRDPLDTPALLTADGATLFVKQLKFATSSIVGAVQSYPGPVYAISPQGEIAATATGIYEVASGTKVYDLGAGRTVQAVTSDYSRLVYFDAAATRIRTVDLFQQVGPGVLRRTLYPGNGAVVPAPSELRWSGQPGLDSYRVYLGTSASAVAAAGTSSPEYRGEVSALAVAPGITFVPGTTYYWRVDGVSSGGVSTGPVYSFTVATVAVSQAAIQTSTVQGHASHVVKLDLTSSTPGKAWTVTSGTPWIGFAAASGVTPATVQVKLNAGALPLGLNQGTITLTDESGSYDVPVNLTVAPLAITMFRPVAGTTKVYAVSEENAAAYSGVSPAFLLEIDTLFKRIDRTVRVGTGVTDFVRHAADGRIYVTNWKAGTILGVNEAAFAIEQSYGVGQGGADGDAFRLGAGIGGRLVTEESNQWIEISLLNTVTGQNVARTAPAVAWSGGSTTDPTGRFYYHAEYGINSPKLLKFDTQGDTITEVKRVVAGGVDSFGSPNLLMSEDGGRLFWNGLVLRSDFTAEWTLPAQVRSISSDGRYAFTDAKVYDVVSQQLAATLPLSTGPSAFSSVSGRLVYQQGTGLGFYALANASLPTRGRTPADGAIVSAPSSLAWGAMPGASAYRIYFGTSEAGVQDATAASPEFLGQVNGLSIGLGQPLTNGQTYYWRIDFVVGGEVAKGDLNTFTVSGIVPGIASISATTVKANPAFPVTLPITAAPGSSWTISSAASWIRFSSVSGTGSANVAIELDARDLPPGANQATITVSGAGGSVAIPVRFWVDALALTAAKADVASGKVYLISEDTSLTERRAYLLEVDTQTEKVLRVVPVGAGVVDLAIHDADGRILIPNRSSGLLRSFDKTTLQQVQTYPFTPTPANVSYGENDLYNVSAGGPGRFIVEEADQWIDASLYNSATGAKLASVGLRQGGAQYGATKRFYYHGDTNISNASLHKFDMVNDTFQEIGARRVETQYVSYFGTRTVVVSVNGERIFWNGAMFDANLNILWGMGDEVVATSSDGRFAYSSTKIYDTVERRQIGTLPTGLVMPMLNPVTNKLVAQRGGALAFFNYGENQPPTASFTLSSERRAGWSLDIFVNVGDPDGNYSFANLWVRTPTRGWLTIKADGSVVASGDVNPANTVATAAGSVHRSFLLSDGPGDYVFSLLAMDSKGRYVEAPSQTITVTSSNHAPTASFTLSGPRQVGQPITVSLQVDDVDDNYRFANLWVRTPGRGWLTVKADNTVVPGGDVAPAYNVASTRGSSQRSFTPTSADGPGQYVFSLIAFDFQGAYGVAPEQTITVSGSANHAPTASFSLSGERSVGQTVTIVGNVGDEDGNYRFANLWVRTPGRGWLSVKADDSVVQSGDFLAANNVALSPGSFTRHFTFTPQDGAGDYVFSLLAVDGNGAYGAAQDQTITVAAPAVNNHAPTAAFSLSGERLVGQTVSINLSVNDVDGNYRYANLWVHTPGRGWLTIKADDSVALGGDLSQANTVAATTGSFTRHFTFTSADGVGDYTFSLLAVDGSGAYGYPSDQTITVAGAGNHPPTASFSLSSQRTIGQTLSIDLSLGDPDGDYRFANLWVHTPGRGWMAIKADDSLAASGDVDPANTVAATTGNFTRHFTLSSADGVGDYTFSLLAVDSRGAFAYPPDQTIAVSGAANSAPTASFTLSGERNVGQTVTLTLSLGDVDGNYRYANLWVRTPNRGWLTIKADDSVAVGGDLLPANSVSSTVGTVTRHFTFTPQDGAGEYLFSLIAIDGLGAYATPPDQVITVQ